MNFSDIFTTLPALPSPCLHFTALIISFLAFIELYFIVFLQKGLSIITGGDWGGIGQTSMTSDNQPFVAVAIPTTTAQGPTRPSRMRHCIRNGTASRNSPGPPSSPHHRQKFLEIIGLDTRVATTFFCVSEQQEGHSMIGDSDSRRCGGRSGRVRRSGSSGGVPVSCGRMHDGVFPLGGEDLCA